MSALWPEQRAEPLYNIMTRFFFIVSFFFFTSAYSQKQFNVMEWKTDATLNTYLIQGVHQQYDQRRINFNKAVVTRQGTFHYIADVKKKFLELLGEFPSPSPLNISITGTLQQPGYRIEKILYESFAHHHVTANLYIPEGKGPFPAALLFCGHENIAKASLSYQQTAVLFVRNGFVVFVIDPVSQSERFQSLDGNGKPATRGGTTEHTLINESTNLLGQSAPAYELWDNKRGLDYLVTRPEVDTSRIGCLGSSGGGMQTIYFAAYDPRIKVMAPCSYLANRERTLEKDGPADGCAQMPGEGEKLLELDDYLVAAAPKPLLILAGRYDFIDYTGTRIAYEELKKVYAVLGQPQKLQLFTYDDGHGISQPKREAAVSWFRRWMYRDSAVVKEKEIHAFAEKELLVTSTGQVATAFPGEVSIFQRNLELFDSYLSRRNNFSGRSIADKRIIMTGLLGIDLSSLPVAIERKDDIENNGLLFQKLIFRRKDETPMPVLRIDPPLPSKKIVVWFNEDGKNKMADNFELINSYLRDQCVVLLCDARGTGETKDDPGLNDPKYYNKEYRNAMTALHTGQSLVGQRTNDILMALDFIKADKTLAGPIELHASGCLALPALHAVFLGNSTARLYLHNTIASFKEILQNPTDRDWYSYVIPGVLEHYDIPDLVKLIGEEKIKFIK